MIACVIRVAKEYGIKFDIGFIRTSLEKRNYSNVIIVTGFIILTGSDVINAGIFFRLKASTYLVDGGFYCTCYNDLKMDGNDVKIYSTGSPNLK
jgi:hypothetical protein